MAAQKTPFEESQREEELFLELLATGNRARIKAWGRSMFPTIWPGDEVLLEPPPFVHPPLAVGDIVLAQAGGRLRLHRLVEATGERYRLKGDTSLHFDPWTTLPNIQGRAVNVLGHGAARPLAGGNRLMGSRIARISVIVGLIGAKLMPTSSGS